MSGLGIHFPLPSTLSSDWWLPSWLDQWQSSKPAAIQTWRVLCAGLAPAPSAIIATKCIMSLPCPGCSCIMHIWSTAFQLPSLWTPRALTQRVHLNCVCSAAAVNLCAAACAAADTRALTPVEVAAAARHPPGGLLLPRLLLTLLLLMMKRMRIVLLQWGLLLTSAAELSLI